jgi:3-oxoacyl-(acyl-carrier-protein) synthase
MGVQDELAVAAAGRAVIAAGLACSIQGERTGLYWATGYIPFEHRNLESLAVAATEPDTKTFSMRRLSTTGFHAVNGLLTFHCLPNMPAFHISVNLDLQGPYFVTYPGPGQWYVALEQACTALRLGEIDTALVGGVAYQNNALVRHHFERLDQPPIADSQRDAAGCLVLERRETAIARGANILGTLCELNVTYQAFDPLVEQPLFREVLTVSDRPLPIESAGPASLVVSMSRGEHSGQGLLRHHLQTRDGITATSLWEFS